MYAEENRKKKWTIEYCHDDGRSGKVNVTTEVGESEAYSYGNKKYGAVTVLDFTQRYDLRYVHE